MYKIILTIQYQGTKSNKKWRLGIPVKESREIFKKRGVPLKVKMPSVDIVQTRTKCGCIDFAKNCNRRKKGYDLYESQIHNWIESSGYINPNKITFKWDQKKRILTFVTFNNL